MKKIIKYRSDILAFLCLFLLIVISIYEKYHLGMLVGFFILFIFFSYERIKKIIFELNIKKVFGVEFRELEIKESIKNELKTLDTSLGDSEIENIADIALNQLQGRVYKNNYYEEMVGYALRDLDLKIQNSISGPVESSIFQLDFLIELDDDRVIGIEAVYSNQRYLNKNKLMKIRQSVESISKADNFAGFILITNSEVKNSDMEILTTSSPSITLIDKTVSPDGILSKIDEYLKNVNK